MENINNKNMHPEVSTIEVKSTSLHTGSVTPIELKKTDLVRLKFVPTLVDNSKNEEQSVRGKLVYEKKNKAESFFPSDTIINKNGKIYRGALRTGKWMEISLNPDETYKLYQGLENLHELYKTIGKIENGTQRYTKLDDTRRTLLKLFDNKSAAIKEIANPQNVEIVNSFLELLTKNEVHGSLQEAISKLQDNGIKQLSASINLERLKRVAGLMQDNLENDREEFWQTNVFKENDWILEEVFYTPCKIFSQKGYVGGKNINNQNGNECDFIYENELTQNISLIEIKTHCTKIMSGKYRQTNSFSDEFSGAINQVINYRDCLMKNYYSLNNQIEKARFQAFFPKCVVIIGTISTLKESEKATLEMYRNSLNNIIVVTFDELLNRINNLIKIMSKSI